MYTKEITLQEAQPGTRYHLVGDIANGYRNGEPVTSHEEVTRKITRITETHVICECGLYTSETSPLLCVLTSVALPVALYVEYKLLTLIPKRK